MSKFLGIKYNMWHLVLGALVMTVGVPLLPLYLNKHFTPGEGLIWANVITFLINALLQSGNENVQALDGGVVSKYGSLTNFQTNSRDDWRKWIAGVFIGAFIGNIIWLVFYVLIKG